MGGHHDYFDQQSGLAVDARETSRVAEFIRQLADDSVLWRSCADRAMAAVEGYSAEAYRARVDGFLQSLHAQYAPEIRAGDEG